MLAAIIIIGVFVFIGFILIVVEGFLLWTMHKRLEGMAVMTSEFETALQAHIVKVNDLVKKVIDGENIIIENFATLDKRVTKLEHEIKEAKHSEIKAKEALKAVSRFERLRQQTDAV